jgi:hypothetical protein
MWLLVTHEPRHPVAMTVRISLLFSTAFTFFGDRLSLRKLALFVLDHTLIPMDSDHAWGEFTMALGWVNPEAFKRQNDAFYELYKNGTLDIGTYVRFSTAALCQQGAEKSLAAHMQYMHEVVHAMIRPQAVDFKGSLIVLSPLNGLHSGANQMAVDI